MNILFICSANIQRSRTAEDMFAQMHPEHNFDSAGTNLKVCKSQGTQGLDEELMQWADKVFVMEDKHFKSIKQHTEGKYSKKIVTLGIKDVYDYGDAELKYLLKERVKF